MRYKYFFLKLVNIILVLVLLAGFQMGIQLMDRDTEIAELQTRVNQLEGEKKDIIEAIEQELGSGAETATKTDSAEDNAEDADATGMADGTYTGSGEGFGGQIVTEVTIRDGQITDIQITEAEGEDDAYLSIACEILNDIIEKQSTEIDTVSGATFSSGGILDAVSAALEEAEK